MVSLARATVLMAAAFSASLCTASERLIINSNTSDPVPRATFEAAVEAFRTENPDLDVEVNVYDHESYKTAIRGWLVAVPPDVLLWFSGNRMRQFARAGLLTDVSDIWTADRRNQFTPAAIDLVSFDGRQYGVPYTSYNIGLFYRADLLETAKVQRLATWEDLLTACEKLQAVGVEPIIIGTRDLWPAAGWFDYLDLRINGFDFHMELMSGTVPYTDRRVIAVFDAWRELLDRECFVEKHTGMSWQESQALLYQGRGAIMLMGTFVIPNFPPETAGKIGFAQFPEIVPGVPLAEDAPTNAVLIPARATNLEGAKRFLEFMMRADVQENYNRTTRTLPVNTRSAVADDPFLRQGKAVLDSAAALAQYFDRDTSEELAIIAMRGFQRFLVEPDSRDAVIAEIERARRRIMGLH